MKTHTTQTRTTTLLLLLLLLLAGAGTAAAAVIERIEVDGSNLVRFHLSEPSVPRVIGLPARLPVRWRISVDFEGATLAPGAQAPVPGAEPIIRVRAEQIQGSEKVRAMIELTRGVGFDVESSGTIVTVRLEVPEAAPPPPTTPAIERPDAPAP